MIELQIEVRISLESIAHVFNDSEPLAPHDGGGGVVSHNAVAPSRCAPPLWSNNPRAHDKG